ncbi:MAG: NADH-quinone oxidoreductase subunit J [Chloroflexi bacterium]|nr:NADH-quinone oxidoreductase subunit J [Chloroflexota bacterium]
MTGLAIAFWIFAIVSVLAALAVVFLRDIFRAALSLILCFLVVAGLYVTLSADFLAAVQVLVYVGAIAVLIILAIMLTREVQKGNLSNSLQLPAFIVSILLLVTIVYAVANTVWRVSTTPPLTPTTAAIADRLFGAGGYILAVDIAAILLLAAVLGVIVLVREK